MFLKADSLAQNIHAYLDPVVQEIQTEVSPACPGYVDINIQLYDLGGNPIVQDLFPSHGHVTPGLSFTLYGSTLHIDTFYLRSEFQRLGLGTRFLSHCFQAARREEIQEISLSPDKTTNAQGYWKKLGFTYSGKGNYFVRPL